MKTVSPLWEADVWTQASPAFLCLEREKATPTAGPITDSFPITFAVWMW